MKILFIDSKNVKNSIRVGLLEQMAHHQVTLIDEYVEAMHFFKKESPQIVIIDFLNEFSSKALDEIIKLKPHQHIITLSDSIDCSETIGCDFCQNNYKKKRILKSQGIQPLMYLIDNFELMSCEHANNIVKIIS